MNDSQEYYFGVELTKDNPTYKWTFEDDEDKDDSDYMIHTLFLKHAVLGQSAVKGERNLIQVETKNFDQKDIKMPLLSLTLGQKDMCNLDISFGHENAVTFRLVEGMGPVALGGQQLVEFPPDEMNSQDESALDEDLEDELTEEEDTKKPSKGGKAKKRKLDESSAESEDEEMDDEDDEEEDEEDEDEDVDSSPEKSKKKKGKDTKAKAKPKTTKASPRKAAKKPAKKAKK